MWHKVNRIYPRFVDATDLDVSFVALGLALPFALTFPLLVFALLTAGAFVLISASVSVFPPLPVALSLALLVLLFLFLMTACRTARMFILMRHYNSKRLKQNIS